jgi:fatty acid desaturase
MSDQSDTSEAASEAEETRRAAEHRARERVDQIKGFYHHLTIYLVVNAVLFLIDIFSGGGTWFYWPLLVWGIAVVIHGLTTFEVLPWSTKEWEERKVRELMARDGGDRP